jgi:hypothetical protein
MPPSFYFPAGGSQCRACSSARAHAASIKRDFDLSAEEYDALLLLQDGRCAVCRGKPISQRLAVDHDHQTGKVLGLLCSKCNREAKGALHDSLNLARNLVHYMEHPPMTGEWTIPKPPETPVQKRRIDRAELDPTYLMFDHEVEVRALPEVLEGVARRMTLDELVLSGGKSDPDSGTYWLAYRKASDEQPPWETTEAPRMDDEGLPVPR